MLELLHIENLAVIETADIQFYPGFNALTGETGAGKSIVVDAMQAVLGGRASRDLIRTGAGSAFVSAVFSGLPGTFRRSPPVGRRRMRRGSSSSSGRSRRMAATFAGPMAAP